MAQPSNATVDQIGGINERIQGFPSDPPKDRIFEVTDVTSGMVTAIPRAKRPLGSSISIINGRIRDDWVGRRGGYPNYITKPNSNDIMELISFKGEENQDWVVRVANGSMHAASTTTGWTSLTGTAYSSFARTDSAQVLGDLYLANSSKKVLRVRLDNLTFAEIVDANAPTAKFITSFAERLIAAYIFDPASGVLPFGLRWSVNADPTDWTGLGSGRENLIQSPSDTGDEITGIFGFSNLMVILRERTIWHVTRQPFADAPFRFTAIITNQGCDMPHTAVQTSDEQGRLTGLLFADSRSNGIYQYTPGQRPQRISRNIDDQLFTGLTDPQLAKAAYDPENQEYHLGYPTDSANPEHLGSFRVFSAQNGSFVTDDGPTCTTIGVVGDVGTPTMIDDLTGFIDGLSGTIDSLSGVLRLPPIVLKGDTSGQSIKEDLDTAGSHTFTWESQNLGSVSLRRTVKLFTMAMSATASGSTTLEFSTDDGSTWTNIKTVSNPSSLSKLGFKKQISADRINWRLTTAAKEFRFTEWWIKLLEKRLKKLS